MSRVTRCRSRRLLAILCFAVLSAHAEEAPDAVRIRQLEQSFRCLVCQNETIADSTADLARDLRGKIAGQVAAGATDQEVRDYMVRRYGDFVLYTPPFKPLTWLLWLGPFMLLCIGALVLLRIVGRRRTVQARALTSDEQSRVEALLGGHATEDTRP